VRKDNYNDDYHRATLTEGRYELYSRLKQATTYLELRGNIKFGSPPQRIRPGETITLLADGTLQGFAQCCSIGMVLTYAWWVGNRPFGPFANGTLSLHQNLLPQVGRDATNRHVKGSATRNIKASLKIPGNAGEGFTLAAETGEMRVVWRYRIEAVGVPPPDARACGYDAEVRAAEAARGQWPRMTGFDRLGATYLRLGKSLAEMRAHPGAHSLCIDAKDVVTFTFSDDSWWSDIGTFTDRLMGFYRELNLLASSVFPTFDTVRRLSISRIADVRKAILKSREGKITLDEGLALHHQLTTGRREILANLESLIDRATCRLLPAQWRDYYDLWHRISADTKCNALERRAFLDRLARGNNPFFAELMNRAIYDRFNASCPR
jgi:hypothetical protein